MSVETKENTVSPSWLVSAWRSVASPTAGREAEGRSASMRECATIRSPGRTARDQRTSSQATPQTQAMSPFTS